MLRREIVQKILGAYVDWIAQIHVIVPEIDKDDPFFKIQNGGVLVVFDGYGRVLGQYGGRRPIGKVSQELIVIAAQTDMLSFVGDGGPIIGFSIFLCRCIYPVHFALPEKT